jgi:sensor histidine kinase YesM
MDILMDLKAHSLQVAILFLLISLLVNLLQRRYSRARLSRVFGQEESIIDFLAGMHKYLGKVERDCTLELHGATSPKEIGKAIHTARNEIQSTMAEMETHLHSFRQYRQKIKAQEKQKKRMEKLDQRLVK